MSHDEAIDHVICYMLYIYVFVNFFLRRIFIFNIFYMTHKRVIKKKMHGYIPSYPYKKLQYEATEQSHKYSHECSYTPQLTNLHHQNNDKCLIC